MDQNATYRVNMLDPRGTVSFLAPPHGPKALLAAIARGAVTTGEVLAKARAFDPQWIERLQADLMRFDEHNVDAVSADELAGVVADDTSMEHGAFRVLDQVSRRRSLESGALGLIVINMTERRIIQVQNSYDELRRVDRGRVREAGEPTVEEFRYRLPDEWSMVP